MNALGFRLSAIGGWCLPAAAFGAPRSRRALNADS
jgi:hypothetical protein